MHVRKPMHNKAKKIAVLGMMAAFSTVLTVLGSIISVNTVFFTAAAAFLTGGVVIFYGMGAGSLFFCVCAALDFLVNPDKLHVFLYLAFALYILICEGSYRGMAGMTPGKKKEWIHRLVRLIVFALLYIPLILFLPRLLVSEKLITMAWFLPVMMPAGFIVWIIYDLAYVQAKKWLCKLLQTTLSGSGQ